MKRTTKTAAAATTIERAEIETGAGTVRIAARDGALVMAGFESFAEQERQLERRFPGARFVDAKDPAGAISALRRWLAGDLEAIDRLECDAGGTEFQRAVWKALREIPAGETVSYGDIARRIGRPKAFRAVGAANGSNPIAIVVPCHRVVAVDGRLVGFGGGIGRKAALLRLEGIDVDGSRPSSRVHPEIIRLQI